MRCGGEVRWRGATAVMWFMDFKSRPPDSVRDKISGVRGSWFKPALAPDGGEGPIAFPPAATMRSLLALEELDGRFGRRREAIVFRGKVTAYHVR
jgi:hypothetical protein